MVRRLMLWLLKKDKSLFRQTGPLLNNSTKVVGLLGPYGFGNLGDAAIQDANMFQLSNVCENVRYVGISMNPGDTKVRHGIISFAYDTAAYCNLKSHKPGSILESLEGSLLLLAKTRKFDFIANGLHWRVRTIRLKYLELLHWLYIANKVRSLDALIISGGGQLDEAWGGSARHPYNIYKWCKVADLFSVNVAFMSVGAGDVKAHETKKYLHRALTIAKYSSFRDIGTQRIVKERILKASKGKVAPDLAFGYDVKAEYLSSDTRGKHRRVAIGPIPYFDVRPGSWPEKDKFIYSSYLDKITSFCQVLMEEEYHLTFIVGDSIPDNHVVKDIVKRLESMPTKLSCLNYSAPSINSVEDLLGVLSTVDAVVTSRFHGVLLALLLYKPVLAISFERKIEQQMADVFQSDFCVKINNFEPNDLQQKFKELWANRTHISRTVKQYVDQYREEVVMQAKLVAKEIIRV